MPLSALSTQATSKEVTIDALNMGINATTPTENNDIKNDQTSDNGPQIEAIVPEAWVNGMPTRLIAQVLLCKSRCMADHRELFEEISTSGMFKSRRHFKHCLKLMKLSKRLDIICLGPEKVGKSRRKFAVKLTARGERIYTCYRRWPGPTKPSPNQSNGDGGDFKSHGLADAL